MQSALGSPHPNHARPTHRRIQMPNLREPLVLHKGSRPSDGFIAQGVAAHGGVGHLLAIPRPSSGPRSLSFQPVVCRPPLAQANRNALPRDRDSETLRSVQRLARLSTSGPAEKDNTHPVRVKSFLHPIFNQACDFPPNRSAMLAIAPTLPASSPKSRAEIADADLAPHVSDRSPRCKFSATVDPREAYSPHV